MAGTSLAHRQITVDGVPLHYAAAGTGPLVLLLHGFPDHWYGWRRQIPALADAGFQVVAPDLRGYNRSGKPSGVRAYRVEQLVGDAVGLIEHCGGGCRLVVGHDWGGLVAWALAAERPDIVERVAVLNCPHPGRLPDALRSPRQWLRSWYVAAFQLPWLPEAVLAAGNGRVLRMILRAGSPAFSGADLDRHVEAMTTPGTLNSAINYYRAAARRSPRRPARVCQPALVLWGEEDPALASALAEPPAAMVPDARVRRLPGVGHWPQLDASDAVNETLSAFARGARV